MKLYAPDNSVLMEISAIERKGNHGELTRLTGIRNSTGSFIGAGDCITLCALLTPI